MALYTIGEVALLCDINPVTLRAWQRRYGLLKPQRTDGGHRLFNDADIDRIREIKRWIDNGVQVSKVKMLLSNENVDVQNGWRDQQETLLTYLQSGNLHSLRTWIKERGQDYPAQTLTTHLFIPLRRRLQCQQATLQALLAILEDEGAGCGQKLDAAKILLSAAPKTAETAPVRVVLPEGAKELMG